MKNLLLIVLGISCLQAGEYFRYTKEFATGFLTSISLTCAEKAAAKLLELDQGSEFYNYDSEAWSDNFEANKATLTKDCEYSALFNMFYYFVQTKLQDIKNNQSIEVQNVNFSNIENFLAAVELKGMFGGESFDFWKNKIQELEGIVSDNLKEGIVKDVSGHEIIN